MKQHLCIWTVNDLQLKAKLMDFEERSQWVCTCIYILLLISLLGKYCLLSILQHQMHVVNLLNLLNLFRPKIEGLA